VHPRPKFDTQPLFRLTYRLLNPTKKSSLSQTKFNSSSLKEIPAMKRSVLHRHLAITLLVLPLLFLTGSNGFGQRQPDRELPLRELLRVPGKLLSEAKSTQPTNQLKLTGYRVEEIKLPRQLNVELHGQQVAVDKAWRVTVQGGPFPVRALPAVIWIDDQVVGNGIENETLSQITAITFDGSLLREGGVVSISYGEDKTTRVRIPQPLRLTREGGIQ